MRPKETNSPLEPAIALRKTFREGYTKAALRADLLAGVVVGIVALPLSLALAIAAGVPPQHGLYTAIVAGGVAAILGGSRVQVTGPTAAFVVVLAPITSHFGLTGLLLATIMAGVILVLLALLRFGRLIEFVPYPVTTGFTGGIAIVIATLQIKDLLGLQTGSLGETYFDKVTALARALPSIQAPEVLVGVVTLVLLTLWPHVHRTIPAALVALSVTTVAVVLAEELLPGLEITTIEKRFLFEWHGSVHSGIPPFPPLPHLPWHWPGGHEPVGLSFDLIKSLLPSAFTIAVLGAIESLLSAVVADGMTRRQHDPNAELLAQGIANIVAPFFGGIAATGAIARTATNVRNGGRSPIAALAHCAFLLLATVLLAPLLGKIPMASLAALLLVVAWNMGEVRHVIHMIRTAPRSDVVVLMTCLTLTVVFDMVVSVIAGVLLAALLFMRRMVEVTHAQLVAEPHRRLLHELPDSVVLYEIFGPLFFGAAARAMRALQTVDSGVKVVVFDLRSVPAIDATGIASLDSAVHRLVQMGVFVVLAGVGRQPLRALIKAGWHQRRGSVAMRRSFDEGILVAKRRAG